MYQQVGNGLQWSANHNGTFKESIMVLLVIRKLENTIHTFMNQEVTWQIQIYQDTEILLQIRFYFTSIFRPVTCVQPLTVVQEIFNANLFSYLSSCTKLKFCTSKGNLNIYYSVWKFLELWIYCFNFMDYLHCPLKLCDLRGLFLSQHCSAETQWWGQRWTTTVVSLLVALKECTC